MKKFTPALNHRLQQLGWPGVAGIGLLLFSASFYLSATRPAAEEAALMRESIASEMKNRSGGVRARRGSLETQLESFYGYFPPARKLPDQLATMYGFADKQGLHLRQGEYRLIQETNAKLERYQVTLPLRGSYTQVRRFIAEVMNEMPVVSLDELKFEKQQIGDPAIEAQIRMTLFLLADSKGKAGG